MERATVGNSVEVEYAQQVRAQASQHLEARAKARRVRAAKGRPLTGARPVLREAELAAD